MTEPATAMMLKNSLGRAARYGQIALGMYQGTWHSMEKHTCLGNSSMAHVPCLGLNLPHIWTYLTCIWTYLLHMSGSSIWTGTRMSPVCRMPLHVAVDSRPEKKRHGDGDGVPWSGATRSIRQEYHCFWPTSLVGLNHFKPIVVS
jgi:hypothetical protein